MKNKIIYLLLVLSLFSVSCEKFLDINPKAEVTNDDMFATPKGCEDALIAIYSELGNEALYGRNMLWNVPEVLAGNFEQDDYWTNDYVYISEYNYNDATSLLQTMWLETYKVISWVNNAIINIEPKDEAEFPMKSLYLGELYGLRAFLHLDLVRFYAPHVETNGAKDGIPYVTTYSFEATPFSTVSEVYEKITADCVKAQELLKDDVNNIIYPRTVEEDGAGYDEYAVMSNFTKRRETHMNIYAVTAVLARAYWTMGEYAKAKDEAEKVIASNMFPLVSKDKVPTMFGGALSPEETIFGVYSTKFYETQKLYLATSRIGATSVWGVGETSFDTHVDIFSNDLNSGASADARTAWIGMADGSDQPLFNSCQKMVDKYRYSKDEDGYDASFDPGVYNLVEGFTVLRVAEMYYIASEGYLKEGNMALAEERFNTMINSRGLTDLSERSPVITLTEEVIYNERWKEYFGEGMRWFDMKKKGMDIPNHKEGVMLPAADQYYVLPMPVAEFSPRTE